MVECRGSIKESRSLRKRSLSVVEQGSLCFAVVILQLLILLNYRQIHHVIGKHPAQSRVHKKENRIKKNISHSVASKTNAHAGQFKSFTVRSHCTHFDQRGRQNP